jgi:Tol biopolymer transport system component
VKRLVVLALVLAAAPLASAAGSGPRIALSVERGSDFDLLTVDADGGNPVELTKDVPFRYERSPAWSPDSSRIAWSSHRDSNKGTEIYAMNVDGSHQTRLTFDSGDGIVWNDDPCWLGDGRIVWVRSVSTSGDLWVMSPDGSGKRRLTTGAGITGNVACSPGTGRLAFPGQTPTGFLQLLDVATGELRTVPTVTGPSGLAWSPDGSFVAAANNRLELVRADGSELRTVGDLPAYGPISWSPDGRSVVVGAERPAGVSSRGTPVSQFDLYRVDVATGAAARLTGPLDPTGFAPQLEATWPTWSPGGGRIFFRLYRFSEPALWTMNADGTCETSVLPGDPTGGLAFQPGIWPTEPPIECVDLRMTVSLDDSFYGLRSSPVVSVTIENDGNQTADGVTVRDPRNDLRGPGCLYGTCSAPSIPPGHAISLTLRIVNLRAGWLFVGVTAASDEHDSEPGNDGARAAARVLPCDRLGTTADDHLVGTSGPDSICGRAGRDHIEALGGNDLIEGNAGADTIDPGPGRDTVLGGIGADVIFARDGERDWIDCGSERDIVYADTIDYTRHCEVVHRH